MLHEPLEHDPLDNLAIVDPEIPEESVADVLKRFFKFGLPSAVRAHYGICCTLIDDALKECQDRGVEHGYSHSTIEAIVELWKVLFEPRFEGIERLAMNCILVCINRSEKSEVEIARECGVTRACVSKWVVYFRERFGLYARSGRSDEARRKFSELTAQRPPRKRKRVWKENKKLREACNYNAPTIAMLLNGSTASGRNLARTKIKP